MSKTVEFEDVVKSLAGVQNHGRYVSALCCYHSDSSPSMLVYPDGFICLSCGAKGNLLKLYKQLNNNWVAPTIIQQPKTVHLLPTDLSELEEVCKQAHNTLIQFDDPLGLYLKKRGIHNRIVPQTIGALNGWYTIPIYGNHRQFLGTVARAGTHIQESTGARFNIPQGQQAMVYVPDYDLIERNDYLVVCYGMLDSLSLCELGIPSCTPTSGKDSLHPEDLDTYRKRIIIIPDKGEESTAIKLRDGLGWRGVLLKLDWPTGKDVNDLLVGGYGEWLKEEIRKEIEK
jgi:hypothetical protein